MTGKKASWLRCLVSFSPAVFVAVFLTVILDGPRLGPLYDFLLRQRPAVPVSRELLVIDISASGEAAERHTQFGDDILEPGTAASLLYTMTELGARALIIQVPILGLSAGGTAGEAEILHRFDEEFSILSRNIRNLFDAIRIGLIAPRDAARYVGELVELSEKGKERLVSALVHRDEEGVIAMERAAALFGNVRRPGDLQVQLITAGEGGRPGALVEQNEYSRARPDRDGVIRRVAPILRVSGQEHIIYGALKTRFESSGIENTASAELQTVNLLRKVFQPAPVLTLRNGSDGLDRIIPLDRNGKILFQLPRRGSDFRRINISVFLAYDEADRTLRRLLSYGEALGIFQGIDGENWPPIIYDFALSLREELVSSPVIEQDIFEEKKLTWISYRNRYFASLEDFLFGPAEMFLVNEAELAQYTERRDSIIQIFAALRESYTKVWELREKLETALSNSFCILGRGSFDFSQITAVNIRSVFYGINPTDAEVSALLANSLLTGNAIRLAGNWFLLLGAVISALLVCIYIKSRPPVSTLGTGVILTLLVGAGFSLSFILSGLWLDPLVPVAACVTGVIFSFTWAVTIKGRFNRRLRLAYGPFVSKTCLKSVIDAGKPLPSQIITARAAVVAIINSAPEPPGNSEGNSEGISRESPAQTVLAFHEKASGLFRKAGWTVIGTERDMVTVCFGSPLERIHMKAKRKRSPFENSIDAYSVPVLDAVDFVLNMPQNNWKFGIDIGDCSFTWTAISGYFALGRPVQKARMLSRLNDRYQSRIIISADIYDIMPDMPMKKLDVLKGNGGAFYSLT